MSELGESGPASGHARELKPFVHAGHFPEAEQVVAG